MVVCLCEVRSLKAHRYLHISHQTLRCSSTKSLKSAEIFPRNRTADGNFMIGISTTKDGVLAQHHRSNLDRKLASIVSGTQLQVYREYMFAVGPLLTEICHISYLTFYSRSSKGNDLNCMYAHSISLCTLPTRPRTCMYYSTCTCFLLQATVENVRRCPHGPCNIVQTNANVGEVPRNSSISNGLI